MIQTPLEVVRERLKKKNALSLKKDGYKLGLAVEGGGAGGVISLGMLMALKDLDILHVFDVFVGCSAGSLNLAYILGDQAEEGLSVYYDHVINHKFMDVARIAKGQYILDMKVLQMIIMEVVKLPEEKLLKNHANDFYITLTSINPVEGHLLTMEQAKTHLLDYLMAGATIPFLGGRPRVVAGKEYLDGTFAYPDMALAGEALGCSHILVLNTGPEGTSIHDKYNNLSSKGYKQFLERKLPEVQRLWQSRLQYSDQLRTLHADLAANRIQAQDICINRADHSVGGFTNDQWLIIDGARKGYQTIVNLFKPEATVGLVPEIL